MDCHRLAQDGGLYLCDLDIQRQSECGVLPRISCRSLNKNSTGQPAKCQLVFSTRGFLPRHRRDNLLRSLSAIALTLPAEHWVGAQL